MKSCLHTYDVCVAGGGFAGLAAAVQSARLGLKTLLIEKTPQWGGAAHDGLHPFLCGLYPGGESSGSGTLNAGLCREIEERLIVSGHGKKVRMGKVQVLECSPERTQELFMKLAAAEPLLTILWEAQVEAVQVEDKIIRQIRVRTQSESCSIETRAVIDCSGGGEVIRLSGASYEIAPAKERQLAAYALKIKGVLDGAGMENLQAAYHLSKAVERGVMAPHLRFSVWMPGKDGDPGVLRISVLPSDSGYDMGVIREQARQVHDVLKDAMPEFRHSWISFYSSRVAEREGLRMRGLYTLTGEDVLAARKFEDGVVQNAWPVEFWDAQKGPRYDYLGEGQFYEIPARCLRSKDISNLFAAGRCISATPRALASARVTGTCLALGEQSANAAFASLKEPSPRINIVETIRRETENIPDRTAFRQGEKMISYGELLRKTGECAHILKGIPVKDYARVGLLVREGIDYVILNLAVLSLQAVMVPIPQASSQEEIRRILLEMKLDVLLFEKSLYKTSGNVFDFSAPFEGLPLGAVCFHPEMKEQKEFESVNPAFIRFTSGTTGESKGVVISHEAILARTDAADQVFKITEKDCVLWVLSMAYHFVVTILLFLRRGAAIVLCEHELPQGLANGLRANEATFIYAAPLHYQAMAQSSEMEQAACGRVRMAVSTTMPLSPAIAEKFAAKFGFELTIAYGIIEAGLPFINASGLPEHRQSVGTLLPGYDVCLDPQNQEGVGTVHLKGPGMFEAYFSPWQKRDRVMPNGWFQTGDLGRLDENGFLCLLGRSQQVIHFMGMKIYPQEVESVLKEYPGIREVLVYGEEHETFGQIPAARLVFEDGHTNEIDEEALRRFCYQRLSGHKVPKKFEAAGSLKKTMSGKVLVNP